MPGAVPGYVTQAAAAIEGNVLRLLGRLRDKPG